MRLVIEVLDLAAEKIGWNWHNGIVSKGDAWGNGLSSSIGKPF
jgi:hypothetical protein